MEDIVKVIIVEDEQVWLKTLELYLKEFGFEIVASANNVQDALTIISNNNYDIALLDINIKGSNSGVELGKMVNGIYNKPFIFVTGSQDTHTIEQAVAANPSAYLLKPVNKISLLAAIQNAVHNYQNNSKPVFGKADTLNDFIFIKTGNKYKKIFWNQVVSLNSAGKYTILFCAADKLEYSIRNSVSQTIKYYIPDNLKDKFAQINRNEVVNIDFVDEISGETITTKFGNFNCSEVQAKELKKKLSIVS